jgi:hypothetical protein
MTATAKIRSRGPRWILVPVRVLAVTFIVTLISFAVSLLLGILGVALGAALRHAHPHMALAYRYVAVPAAAIVAGVVLVSITVLEVRHYRQSKALSAIENAG